MPKTSRSNKLGGLGAEPPAAGGQRGFGAEPPTLRRIFHIFPKNKAFQAVLV